MKVKLIDVRLSFPDLFTAVQYNGQGPFNYRASFLFPPSHVAGKAIEAAIAAAAKEKWPTKHAAILAQIRADKKCCLSNGSDKAYDGYAGNLVLVASRDQSKGGLLVLDRNAQKLEVGAGKLYAGCYVDASVDIWPQDNKFGKGIRATLLGVQFRRDGDAFTAGAQVDPEDFGDLSQELATADDLG